MYSLIKGYLSSSNVDEEEHDSVFAEEVVRSRELKAKRTTFRSSRSKSESSAVSGDSAARYLSWENVSFLGHELRKTVRKGFHWLAYPSLDSEMSFKVKKPAPLGTKEYMVDNNDTLAKIALTFDTTPSELTRINKLSSRMLFPGQTLFVPDKRLEKGPDGDELTSAPITKPPQPLVIKENGASHRGEQETVKLTKDVSWEEEEEEVTEHYLKIYAKYITDGQGIANGVLLITPHSVMFKPNVSDPLVMDRGLDTYGVGTLMTSVTSAAMYTDIAAMAIHDPLKPGKFYLDAATAESLSRQNSIDVETAPLTICKNGGKVCTNLDEDTDPLSSVDISHICACSVSNFLPVSTDEDVKNAVREIIEKIVNQVADSENIHHLPEKTEKSVGTPLLLQGSPARGYMHSVSPASEDSGIGCSMGHADDSKAVEPELADHAVHQGLENQLNDSGDARSSVSSNVVEPDENRPDEEHSRNSPASVDRELEHSRSTSLFAALSSNVRYWLGQENCGTSERQGSESDEDVLVPKPATSFSNQPLYLCLRISKKHWCRHQGMFGSFPEQGEQLQDRDKKRREYWFAIPPSRTEQVYRFFQQWCPNIHNATDEESEDDETTSPNYMATEEEGLHLVESFYSNSPPARLHGKLSRALSDSEVPKVKKGLRRFAAKPGKAAKVKSSPKSPASFLIEDVLPDMDCKSEMLNEEHLRKLNSTLPSRTIGHCWALVYSTFQHGFSLKTLYRKMECYDTPVLLVVMDDAQHIFGSLCSCPFKVSEGFYGTGESFLYKFENNSLKIFAWTGENNFFIKGSKDSLAIGSGGGNFGLWLDGDLYHGRSHPCTTFNNAQLSWKEDFLCSGLEAWTFV